MKKYQNVLNVVVDDGYCESIITFITHNGYYRYDRKITGRIFFEVDSDTTFNRNFFYKNEIEEYINKVQVTARHLSEIHYDDYPCAIKNVIYSKYNKPLLPTFHGGWIEPNYGQGACGIINTMILSNNNEGEYKHNYNVDSLDDCTTKYLCITDTSSQGQIEQLLNQIFAGGKHKMKLAIYIDGVEIYSTLKDKPLRFRDLKRLSKYTY